MYVLEVMSGPLDGTRWRFEHEITIGRDEGAVGASIPIDRYLSRSHARLHVEAAGLAIVDLSSRNGTSVDGKPVEQATLAIGKAFTCGRTLMRVVVEAGGSAGLVLTPPISRVTTVAEMRSRLLAKPVGFVPTMGALHEGHLRLVEQAQTECASVVVSIYVNPLQFAAGEDLARYPRDVQGDLRKLSERGVSVVFTPDDGELYPADHATYIDVGAIAGVYEGAVRPAHFRGVATVVAKLLHVVAPTRCYFGQKDAQQVAVIRQMIRDLDFSTEIVVAPTVREADGLALSSRNVYLRPEERKGAPALYKALVAAAAAYREGALRREASQCGRTMITAALQAAGVTGEIEYLDIVDPDRFTPVDDAHETRARALAVGALRFSSVRLLDNVPVGDG